MKRTAGWLLTLAAAGGCVATDMDGMTRGNLGSSSGLSGNMPRPPMLSGVVGARGEPVAIQPTVGPFAPGGREGVGPEIMQAGMPGPGGPGNHLMQAGGVPPMPMPPMMLAQGGGMPPMGGGMPPMGGGMPPMGGGMMPPGMGGQQQQAPQAVRRTQIRFVGPAGGKIGWQVATGAADAQGRPVVVPSQIDLPGRFNFIPASIYRLKLSNIPGRPGLELYPTIDVWPPNAKSDAFLAHNYVPVEFTDEDFDQVTAGNFITKVIYLPDAQFQMSNTGGAEELSSTRLDPGIDPVAEACKRGHVLLVIRLGGIDLEARNTPPLEGPGGQGGACPPQAMMGGMPQMPQMPGIAPPMPAGMPGMPPIAPGGPIVRTPMAPNGPMIPGRPDTLPSFGPSAKKDSSKSKVQQVGYYTPDGKFVPCDPPANQPPVFPQTSIPPGDYAPGTPYGPGKEPVEKVSRRGIFATVPR